jgi:hypothetical protein
MKCLTCGLEIKGTSTRMPLLACPRCGRPLEEAPSRHLPRPSPTTQEYPGVPRFTLPVQVPPQLPPARKSIGRTTRRRSRGHFGLHRDSPYQALTSSASPALPVRAPIIITALSIIVLMSLLVGAGLLLRASLNASGAETPPPPHHHTATATVGPTAIVGAGAPLGPVIYQNSLRGAAGGWTNDSHCSDKPDGYHIVGDYLCYAPVTRQANVDFLVTVTQLKGPTNLLYGIVLRSSGKGNYYLFGIDGNGKWIFAKLTNNSITDLVKPKSSAVINTNLNHPNTLEVRAVGSQFNFYVNGIQVGQASDSAYSTGLVGLTSDASPEGTVEVVYANIQIAQP